MVTKRRISKIQFRKHRYQAAREEADAKSGICCKKMQRISLVSQHRSPCGKVLRATFDPASMREKNFGTLLQSPSLRDKSDTTRPRASPLGPGASPEAPDTQNPSKGFAPRPRGLFGGLGYPNPTKGFAPWRQGLFRGPCMHSAACAALGGFADAKTSGSLCRGDRPLGGESWRRCRKDGPGPFRR